MKKNNKNKARDLSPKNVPQKDIFDVRENLKKLRSGSDNYSTKEPSFDENENRRHLSSEASTNQITGSQSYASDKVDVLRDRLAIDLSIITQKLDDHKEKTNERFSGEISNLRNEITSQSDKFENKISSFVTKEWFGGVIAVTLLIAGIIYTLSYSNVLSDIEKLKIKQEETEKKVEKVSTKLDYSDENDSVDSLSKKNIEKESNIPAGNSR